MELLLLLGVFGMGFGALLLHDDSDAGGYTDPPIPEPEEPLDLSLIEPGDYTGTEGNDTISVADGITSLTGVTIDSGAGDDSLVLATAADPVVDTNSAYIYDSSIDAGAGADTVTALTDGTTISGGDGDDMLTVAGASTYVYGDAGNDTLLLDSNSGEMVADGGDGDDTIDASRVTLGAIYGGAGNDHITATSYNSVGQAVGIYGGDGDDTIDLDVRSPTDSWDFIFPVTGGEGADTFNIQIGEGIDRTETGPTGASTVLAQVITDFDPAVDQLTIEPVLDQDTSSLTAVTLREVTDSTNATGTEVVLSYDLGTATRDVVIWLPGATGMTLGDIALMGDLAAGLA